MKLISFAVPCYNSADYMQNCIDSLLAGGDEVEIIIINDGSTDNTFTIAERYRMSHPGIVKTIHKQNGGHGSGINCGVKESTGLYFKCVDSDDWVDTGALGKLLTVIREHNMKGCLPDLYITNFVYEHAEDNTRHVSRYTDKLPIETLCDWTKMKEFRRSHMLLMHALTYRRDKLILSETILPEHTFYVDNLFAYKPLPFMNSIYYIDVDFYRYFIGRSDQSVNIKNFVRRYDQQIRVIKCMVQSFTYNQLKTFPKGLKKYLLHALSVVMLNTIFFTCADDSEDRRIALKEMWEFIKAKDRKLHNKLKYQSYVFSIIFLPWRLRGKVMTLGYKILCKKIKLG